MIYVDQNTKPIIERITFEEILNRLPDSFIRIHRSFIINTAFVTKYNSTNVWLNYTLELPLSRTFKAPFFNFMTSKVSLEKKVKAQ